MDFDTQRLRMRPLIRVALTAIGGVALTALFARESQRINAELDAQRERGNGQDSMPRLRRDPQSGAYRP
jgi:hypothetical protein